MSKKYIILTLIIVVIAAVLLIRSSVKEQTASTEKPATQKQSQTLESLTITAMREKAYPGSELKIEETLEDGENYHQYIASYQSDGLKIYGLLTVPTGDKPKDGWPAIIFNHGYIPPTQYRTTERYVAYVDAFAINGYVVFKADYRGHGSSEGQPEGVYYSPGYTVDVLNALSSVKKLQNPSAPNGRSGLLVDTNRIGMWGHSLGGNITLRSLVVKSNDIKVAVIWGGIVGTYDDLMNNWQRRVTYSPPPNELALRNRRRAELLAKYGTPKTNPKFWNSIDPNAYLTDITAPVQLHTGLEDEEVPWQFSQGLDERLKKMGKVVEFYTYDGADHNISEPSFDTAIQRSIEFFDRYLK